MNKKLMLGLGLGFALYPALGILHSVPLIGRYATTIIVIIGVVLMVVGLK